MRILKWLYPGLKIKRWLFLAAAGVILMTIGLSLLLEASGFLVLTFFAEYFGTYLDNISALSTGGGLIVLGILILILGLQKLFHSILNVFYPDSELKLVETIYHKRQLKRGPKIVALGGGTGLSVLLRGLKNYTSNLTAVVTVTDDGGSSGKLRGELGTLPPGDIRNCLLALADKESLMEQVLNYRFHQGEGLKGHNLGNLILVSLTQVTGDFYRAIEEIGRVLAIRGSVLPATLAPVILGAKMENGDTVLGETKIVKKKGTIREVFLKPQDCKPLARTLEAIREADAIVLGPGSLYTSIIPTLLVREIRECIKEAGVPVFYVCNVMTQPGETDGYDAENHLDAIIRHTDENFIDYVIVNSEKVPEELLAIYREEGAEPVVFDERKLRKRKVKIIKAELLRKNNYVRHDPDRLARVIVKEILSLKPHSERIKMLDLILNEKFKDFIG